MWLLIILRVCKSHLYTSWSLSKIWKYYSDIPSRPFYIELALQIANHKICQVALWKSGFTEYNQISQCSGRVLILSTGSHINPNGHKTSFYYLELIINVYW